MQNSPVFLFPGNIGLISIPHHQMRNTWQSDVTCEGIWLRRMQMRDLANARRNVEMILQNDDFARTTELISK